MKTKHLTCKEIAKHLCGELDEQLDTPKCRAIKKHLSTCPNCTGYLDSLKNTVRLYREYHHPRLTNDCRKKLFAVLKIGK